MEQVDFGRIISAAAVSTLGVLSLIIVALGVIAFFFFKGSPEKIKLSVWWTMVLGGGLFAAAVVRQSESKEPGPVPAPTQTPAPIDTTRPGPIETPSPEPSAVPSSGPTTAPVIKPEPVLAAPVSETARSDISGRWRDDDGYNYLLAASGNTMTFQQWLNGMAAGYGQGTINGRNLRYGFVTADGRQGGCTATVAESGRQIDGACTSGGATWPFTIKR